VSNAPPRKSDATARLAVVAASAYARRVTLRTNWTDLFVEFGCEKGEGAGVEGGLPARGKAGTARKATFDAEPSVGLIVLYGQLFTTPDSSL
jgi:hypothetical protein